VGIGLQGSGHVKNFLRIPGVEVRALCDIVPAKVVRAQKWAEKAGQPTPRAYDKGPTDFERLCAEEDVDLVVTATPWEWHVPVCLAAMASGKHAATEVPAALTVAECWQLVDTVERTGLHCVMLENCCYGRRELMTLNMVRRGLLGELLHAEAGYLHDLRYFKFNGKDEALWRTAHSVNRNGNLYPTHGLGPVAQCMDVNRGDRFTRLVSMSSRSAGLNLYAAKKFGPDHPSARQEYALGDINVSLLATEKGRVVVLYHDCSSPRPYSRIHVVQGTRGLVRGWPDQIHVEGRSPAHEWEELYSYAADYEHPLWRALQEQSVGSGHDGMDFLEDWRLVRALQSGTTPDMDVYDAADWSAVAELSERSVAAGGQPQEFPDFTRGRWRERSPLPIVGA